MPIQQHGLFQERQRVVVVIRAAARARFGRLARGFPHGGIEKIVAIAGVRTVRAALQADGRIRGDRVDGPRHFSGKVPQTLPHEFHPARAPDGFAAVDRPHQRLARNFHPIARAKLRQASFAKAAVFHGEMVCGPQVVVDPNGIGLHGGGIQRKFLPHVFAHMRAAPAKAIVRLLASVADHIFRRRALVHQAAAVPGRHVLPMPQGIAQLQRYPHADGAKFFRDFPQRFRAGAVRLHAGKAVVGGQPNLVARAGMRLDCRDQFREKGGIFLRFAAQSLCEHDKIPPLHNG